MLDDFKKGCQSYWTQVTTGGGYLKVDKSVLRLGYDAARAGVYSDAQIDDYTLLSKSKYLWKPPLRMTVRARASHQAASQQPAKSSPGTLKGTAGFGFWNKPFSMQGRWYTLPQSVWFFYSAPPSNMALVPGVPGWGWKAQVVNTTFRRVVLCAVPLAATALFARLTGRTAAAQQWLQRFTGAEEIMIAADLTDWHEYELEWHQSSVAFSVDGTEIMRTTHAPTKALGLVAWLDNEYAVATPKGELEFGKTKAGPQWLDIDSVKIERLAS